MNAPSPTMAPAPPPPPASGGGYPAGTDIVNENKQAAPGAMPSEPVENPVVAGFRSIMLFIKTLQDNNDPRAAQAKEHVVGLLQTLQGNAPAGGQVPPAPAGQAPMQGGAPNMPEGQMPGAPPVPGPSAPPAPPSAPLPPKGAQPMGMNSGAKGNVKPMQKMPTAQGKQPVVLT